MEPAYKRLNVMKNNESAYLDDKLFYDFVRCLGLYRICIVGIIVSKELR